MTSPANNKSSTPKKGEEGFVPDIEPQPPQYQSPAFVHWSCCAKSETLSEHAENL